MNKKKRYVFIGVLILGMIPLLYSCILPKKINIAHKNKTTTQTVKTNKKSKIKNEKKRLEKSKSEKEKVVVATPNIEPAVSLKENQMKIEGEIINIGPLFSLFSDGLPAAQAHIDSNPNENTGVGWNENLVGDNKMSLIFGHNPGIMTKIADKIKVGSIIEVKDVAGSTRTYKVEKMGTNKNPIYNGGTFEWSSFYDYLLDNEIENHEGIVIQFCRDQEMELWCAYPI